MTTFKLIITSCAILLISNLFQYGQGSNESIDPQQQQQQQQQQQKQCTHDDDGGGGGECNNMNMNTNTNMNADMDDIHKAFKWNIDEEHRCNIKKLSFKDLYKRFNYGLPPLYHEPLVLYYEDENNYNNHNGDSGSNGSNDDNNNNNNNHEPQCIYSKFEYMSSIENITKTTFPQNFEVTLSSSNSFSAHRRTIPLSQYIDETMNHEIFPNQLSNLTWYLFGETYSNEWKEVLNNYCLPPCQTCTDDLSALSFGIGGKGSGVQWHVHGPGFSESIHGNKHWVLYPPNQKPKYDPDFTSRHWMEEVYTSLSKSKLPFECTLKPGEMIYFPDGWYHATINLSQYTAFVSTFTTEHGFERKGNHNNKYTLDLDE